MVRISFSFSGLVRRNSTVKVAPDKADLIETRVIGGIKYILINAEEDVEVNGVRINIEDREKAGV